MYMKYIEHIMYEGYTLIAYRHATNPNIVIGTVSSGPGTPVISRTGGRSVSYVLNKLKQMVDSDIPYYGDTPNLPELYRDEVVQYEHHGRMVSVKETMKGRHRDICLCFAGCAHFKPNEEDNCAIAQENFNLCKKHGTVQPVLECPKYQKSHEQQQ